MAFISIFNDVLGPVMRGPSSSHTAGAYRIATIARSLLGEAPVEARFSFDPGGSYAPTYEICGVDLALASGLLRIEMTDEAFHEALELAAVRGLNISFDVRELTEAKHPNHVEIELTGAAGRRLSAAAESVGGGAIVFTRVDEWPVELTGKSHEVLVECEAGEEGGVVAQLTADGMVQGDPDVAERGGLRLVTVRRQAALPKGTLPGEERVWQVEPVFHVQRGEALFGSATEMVALAEERNASLGEVALEYECALLELSSEEALAEMRRRLAVMEASVERGLAEEDLRLQLQAPMARRVLDSEAEGKVALGGIHTRAAARAMAAMHVNNSMGVVCAAPTGGSAGVIPGVLTTLVGERSLGLDSAAMALFAAGAVGLIVAMRATFAAETAGCQVEIGAAGAMAAAAVVDAAGGTARQAADAAAIALQNCMGLVCDPVQGACEIPCNTRNAVAASSAFVCADLVMGGYENPIPLDETVDAVLQVGKMMARELRCTALGGIAAAPSARALRGAACPAPRLGLRAPDRE